MSPVLEHTTSHLLAMKRHDQAAAFAELQTLASLLEPDDAAAEQAAAELQRPGPARPSPGQAPCASAELQRGLTDVLGRLGKSAGGSEAAARIELTRRRNTAS